MRAFHFGTHFLVEVSVRRFDGLFRISDRSFQVDIVLPEEMSLREAHDIGEELQKKIERLPEVERV